MQNALTRKLLLSILLLFVLSRAILLFTGYVGMNLFASYDKPPAYEHQDGSFSAATMKIPEDLHSMKKPQLPDFIKFDSFAYLKIMADGYDAYPISQPHPPADWVFFPLYPLLLLLAGKLAGLFTLLNPIVLGMLLSNAFLILALIYVYLICLQQGMAVKQARNVLLFMLVYPTSLFFSLPYTESLFLLLSAASIYHASRKQYAWAFLAASLSTVTRVPGFINLFFVSVAMYIDLGYPFTKKHLRWLAYSLLSFVPMCGFLLYMKRLTGDWLAPFHEQSLNWYRMTASPFTNYSQYFQTPYFMSPGGWDNGLLSFVMSTAVFLIFIAYAVVHGKKLYRDRKQLLMYVYGVLLIVVPFSSQPWYLSSVIRYMMVCIPLFLYLAALSEKSESVRTAYTLLFMSVNVITTIGFFNGYYFMA